MNRLGRLALSLSDYPDFHTGATKNDIVKGEDTGDYLTDAFELTGQRFWTPSSAILDNRSRAVWGAWPCAPTASQHVDNSTEPA